MNNEPVAFVAGILTGVFMGTCIWGLGVTPMVEEDQFKKDCVKMAHGEVDKSAKNICVKNGKILFRK